MAERNHNLLVIFNRCFAELYPQKKCFIINVYECRNRETKSTFLVCKCKASEGGFATEYDIVNWKIRIGESATERMC